MQVELKKLQQSLGITFIFVTHDQSEALSMSDRVAVFSDGTIVEETGVESFSSADALRHPFSRALWRAMPGHEFAVAAGTAGEGDK